MLRHRGPFDLVGRCRRCGGGPGGGSAGAAVRPLPPPVLRAAAALHALELDERDVLRLAVLGDAEVFRGQPFDDLAVLVLHGHRLDDEARGGAKHRLLCLLLLLRAAVTAPRARHTEAPRHRELEAIFLRASVPRCVVIAGRISKPHPQTRLHASHLVRLARQPELRAADERVDARVGHAIEHVGRVDPPVHVEPAAPRERARDACVQRELRRSSRRVASRVAPFARMPAWCTPPGSDSSRSVRLLSPRSATRGWRR